MRINFTSSVLVISALLSSAAQAQPTGPLPQPARPTIPPFAPILPEPLIESVRLSTFSHPKLNANATDGPPALRQGAAMVIVVGNVGGAQSVSITEVKSNNCGWVNQPNINYAPLTPDREGKIQQTRIGVFTTGNSSCTVRATIVIQKHQTSSPNPPLELVSAPFQLTGSRTVDLDTFSKIDRLFNFELKYGYGVCEGFSDFGAGRHPVGKVADPRNDFAIAIRSGPIGTDCRWHSQMVELPPGVKPIINTWDITASASNESQQNLPPEAIAQATCSIIPAGIFYMGSAAPFSSDFDFSRGTEWLPVGPFQKSTNPFLEGFAPIVTSDVTVIPAESGAPRYYHAIIPPLRVNLLCGRTLINDQWGVLTFKSVRFSVPNNITFP